jgi:hypothetical protein
MSNFFFILKIPQNYITEFYSMFRTDTRRKHSLVNAFFLRTGHQSLQQIGESITVDSKQQELLLLPCQYTVFFSLFCRHCRTLPGS